jgi:hypothetical protein
MRQAGIAIAARSSSDVIRLILRFRRPGHHPVARITKDEEQRLRQMGNSPPGSKYGGLDDLGMAISFMMGVLKSGDSLSPKCWKEVFLRLGQTGRYDELERLALWLATFYGPRTGKEVTARLVPARLAHGDQRDIGSTGRLPVELPTSHPAHPLSVIFSSSFQQSIVSWPFIMSPFHNIRREPQPNQSVDSNSLITPIVHQGLPFATHWTRGLRLLIALQERGVMLCHDEICRAYHQRLMILYGPGRSNKPVNRKRKEENEVPFHRMLEDAMDLWGRRISVGLPKALMMQLPASLIEQFAPVGPGGVSRAQTRFRIRRFAA